jgi:hypothetical protein
VKNTKQTILENKYLWVTSAGLPEQAQNTLLSAAVAIQSWLRIADNLKPHSTGELRRKTGVIFWKPSNLIWRKAGFHHVEFHTVFIDPRTISVETAVHEMAHVLDNSLGVHTMASVFGGGPADEMIRFIGGEPDLFLPRFFSARYEASLRSQQLELNPTTYGRMIGPAEDFAESFRLAVLHPEILQAEAPKRYDWFSDWRIWLAGKT